MVTNLQQARELLIQLSGDSLSSKNGGDTFPSLTLKSSDDGKIIEGIFDGENMIGPDGKKYSVPPNYASKSKLVFGDRLKLIISDTGKFTYKQIGPVERRYVTGAKPLRYSL